MLPQSMAVGILMTSNPLFRVRNNGMSVVDLSSTKELWFNVTLWKEYRLVTENKQGFYKNKFCYGRNRRRTPWRKHSFLKLNNICRKILTFYFSKCLKIYWLIHCYKRCASFASNPNTCQCFKIWMGDIASIKR